jgi:hypothetical protein
MGGTREASPLQLERNEPALDAAAPAGRGASERQRATQMAAANRVVADTMSSGSSPRVHNDAAHDPAKQREMRALERSETLRFARGFGLADENAVAGEQARFMGEQARQTNTSHEQIVERGSQYEQQRVRLSPREIADWTTRGQTVAQKVVAHMNARHPEIPVSLDQFRVDIPRAARDKFFASTTQEAGKTVIYISIAFIQAAEANPEYVAATIVHELHGHPEYGHSYTEDLYVLSRGQLPGETVRQGLNRAEFGMYAYPTTELFAELRELEYEVDVPDELRKNDHSRDDVFAQVEYIKKTWAPRVAAALLYGFWCRIRDTPEISPKARDCFRAAIRRSFKRQMAEAILDETAEVVMQ